MNSTPCIQASRRFEAIVLAGDRGSTDPVAQAAGAPCKALAHVGGKPMLLRVLDSLAASREVDGVLICGPRWDFLEQEPDLSSRVAAGEVRWVGCGPTPSASAQLSLSQFSASQPVLVTTADHALLTPEMVDHFLGAARPLGCDLAVGIARYESILQAHPDARRTVTRLRDGGFCGCNLYAFLTPLSRKATTFYRRLEEERKNPLRLAAAIGWGTVLRYASGLLSLEAALEQLSRSMGLRVQTVELPFADAAVDVDKVSDLRLVEAILSRSAP